MAYRLATEKEQRPEKKRRRKRPKLLTVAVLPTLLTLGNLLCGFAAVFLASRSVDSSLPWNWSPLTFASLAIFLGMVFDGLDGHVARLTRSSSDLGEQLDSMADMVTFGVAPAFIAVQLVGIGTPFLSEGGERLVDRVTIIIAGIYVACAALRLARFNVEIDQPEEADHSSFKGLPSPGAAGTIAGVALLHQHFAVYRELEHWSVFASSMTMVGIMLLAALAMVSQLRYSHVVNRYIRGRARFSTFSIILILLLLLFSFPQASVAGVFVLYALSAPVSFVWQSLFSRKRLKSALSFDTDEDVEYDEDDEEK